MSIFYYLSFMSALIVVCLDFVCFPSVSLSEMEIRAGLIYSGDKCDAHTRPHNLSRTANWPRVMRSEMMFLLRHSFSVFHSSFFYSDVMK